MWPSRILAEDRLGWLDTVWGKWSVWFSRSVVSNSLWHHGLQHARPPCPSPTGAYSNSCPLSWWCYPTISVIPFSSHLQSFPASGSFLMSQLFTSGGQSIGVSASISVLPMNIQDWFPLGWTPCIPRDSQESSPTPQFKSINSSMLSFLYSPYMTTGKTIALTRQIFVSKVMAQLFNMLSRLVITFLPRNKRLFISWLQSPSAVILEPPKIKFATVSTLQMIEDEKRHQISRVVDCQCWGILAKMT